MYHRDLSKRKLARILHAVLLKSTISWKGSAIPMFTHYPAKFLRDSSPSLLIWLPSGRYMKDCNLQRRREP